MTATLRVLPFGGLGEIGKNMAVVEYDRRLLVICAMPVTHDGRAVRPPDPVVWLAPGELDEAYWLAVSCGARPTSTSTSSRSSSALRGCWQASSLRRSRPRQLPRLTLARRPRARDESVRLDGRRRNCQLISRGTPCSRRTWPAPARSPRTPAARSGRSGRTPATRGTTWRTSRPAPSSWRRRRRRRRSRPSSRNPRTAAARSGPCGRTPGTRDDPAHRGRGLTDDQSRIADPQSQKGSRSQARLSLPSASARAAGAAAARAARTIAVPRKTPASGNPPSAQRRASRNPVATPIQMSQASAMR